MSLTLIIKKNAKLSLIRDVFQLWYNKNPTQARGIIRYIRDLTAQDIKTSGAYEAAGVEAFCQVRFPSELMLALQALIPDWGKDDQDIKDLVEALPDLLPKQMKGRIRGKKKVEKFDPRPRKTIWTDTNTKNSSKS